MCFKQSRIEGFFNSISNFRIFYVVNLFFQSFIFLDAACCVVDGLLLVWSVFLLKNLRIKNKAILSVKYFKLALLFIFLCLVTAFLHIAVNLPFNFFEFAMILHYAGCFFLFYGMHAEINKEQLKKETTLVFKAISFLNTAFVAFSFILIIFKRQMIFSGNCLGNSFRYIAGIYTVTGVQRFTGLYENPNIVAFCSSVSIMFLHMLLIKGEFFKNFEKWPKRVILAFFLLINFLALMLSDSIASFLFLTIYIILVLFNKCVSSSFLGAKQKIKNLSIFMFNTFLVVCFLMFIRQSLQEGASSIISSVSLDSSCSDELSNINFGRIAYSLGDGNGRLELLSEAMEIFKRNPLFGIGVANVQYYGKLYFKNGVAFPNFHNGYLSVLACYGILAFLTFMVLLCTIVFRLVGLLLKNVGKKKLGVFPHCVAAICSYLVYAVSEKTMLSEINIMGIFIWLMLGYAASYAKLYLRKEQRP